jgi:hypothetical protein
LICVWVACRSATRQLRYDVNNLINNAASDMSVHWNKTNRAFTDRISETQDAHRNLKSNLILTKNVSSSYPGHAGTKEFQDTCFWCVFFKFDMSDSLAIVKLDHSF